MSAERDDPISADEHSRLEDLLARYAWSLDGADVETFASLFVSGGTVEDWTDRHEDPGPVEARAYALRCRGSRLFPGRQHWTADLQAWRASNGYRLRSFAMATQLLGPGSTVIVWTGYAEDAVVLEGEDVRFAARTIKPWNGEILAGFPDLVAVDARWAGARGMPA